MPEIIQLVPPGGWRYKESKTNTTIVGMNLDDLIKSIKNHRRINGITEGEVVRDFWCQIKEYYPDYIIPL